MPIFTRRIPLCPRRSRKLKAIDLLIGLLLSPSRPLTGVEQDKEAAQRRGKLAESDGLPAPAIGKDDGLERRFDLVRQSRRVRRANGLFYRFRRFPKHGEEASLGAQS
jgi:hypothetical protein